MRSANSSYDGNDLDGVAADAELAAPELVVVALVLDVDQLAEDLVALDPLPRFERQHHPVVRLGRAEAVDARHARDDDDVAPLKSDRVAERRSRSISSLIVASFSM